MYLNLNQEPVVWELPLNFRLHPPIAELNLAQFVGAHDASAAHCRLVLALAICAELLQPVLTQRAPSSAAGDVHHRILLLWIFVGSTILQSIRRRLAGRT